MRKTALQNIGIGLGLGLAFMTACPGDPGVDTDDTDSSTTFPETTNEPDPDTTNTPSTPPTTGDDTTTTTATTTVDPDTTSPTTTPDPTTGETTNTDTGTETGTETGTDTDTTTGGATTLCERLGGPGAGGINDLVVDFVVNRVLLDQRINGYFLNDDVEGGPLIQNVTDQLGEAVGCEGVVYMGLDMLTAHAGLGISAQDFTDFAEDFQAALDGHQAAHPDVTDDDKATIMNALAALAPEIVEDAENNLTVYQRVGRKPNIQALIGDPNAAESFVGVVAQNPAINSFFANSDFVRLNTCLTRQVGGLDGPIKYGAEVDSPGPGIDEGVAADNKCRDMVSSHENLMDADMTTITVEDFLALVTDLVTAMNTAGVAQADQDIILGALGPLCDQIVVGAAEKNKCPGNAVDVTAEAANIGGMVADDDYDGTLGSMLCTNVNVADDGINFVNSVELEFGADSTWVGDLTIKVVSPGGTTLTVLNRPTADAMDYPDNGTGCCGYSSNLNKANRLMFKNGGANDAEKMGMGLTDAQTVCLTDMKCEYFPNPATDANSNDFDDFVGESAVGDWQVCVGDSGPQDFTTLDYVGLKINKVKFN